MKIANNKMITIKIIINEDKTNVISAYASSI